MFNLRKSLIKLAKKFESAWQTVDWLGSNVQLEAGWYILEFVIEGANVPTQKLVVKKHGGGVFERVLVGATTGRNRKLVYLPAGRLLAFSQSLDFITFARVPAWEGRARVMLICARYQLDFFGPITLLKMLLIQFKSPLELSEDVMNFYMPPEANVLVRFEYWRRRPRRASLFVWWLRNIKIGVVIEDEQQREALQDLTCPPDYIIHQKAECAPVGEVDYYLPLASTEILRKESLLILKLELWRAKRRLKGKPILVYTDHDYAPTQTNGQPAQLAVYKPSASLAYLHCFNYIGFAFAIAATELDSDSPLDILDEDKQYEYLLRLLARSDQCLHVPELIFFSKRTKSLGTPKPPTRDSLWPNIDWVPSSHGNRLVAAPTWSHEPSVDLLIPTRDGLEFLKPCVEGILDKTIHQNYHIYIVDNGSEKRETLEWLGKISEDPRVSIVDFPGEFNFSAINNKAAAAGSGDFIGLINNDIEVINGNWLTEMLVWAVQPSVGIVGAKLLFGNDLVQHAGVTIGMGNAAGHLHRLEPKDSPGYQNRCIATQNMMAVTAACLITPRQVYERMDGLNERDFKVAYNDIDYCLRVERSGLEVIWTPEACLYHLESVSRGDDMSDAHIERYFKELTRLQKRWKTKGFVDKYYNKNLRIGDEGVYPHVVSENVDALNYLG